MTFARAFFKKIEARLTSVISYSENTQKSSNKKKKKKITYRLYNVPLISPNFSCSFFSSEGGGGNQVNALLLLNRNGLSSLEIRRRRWQREKGGTGTREYSYLQGVIQLVADVHVLVVVVDLRVVSDERVLRADVDGVVDLPVDVPHLPGRMEQTL